MSYKDVLKIFKLERELSDNETAFLNTLRQMSDADRELLAETLGLPMKAKVSKAKTKHFQKCGTCGISKRAAHHRDVNHRDYHEFDSGGAAGVTEQKKSKRASELAEKVRSAVGGAKTPSDDTFNMDDLCKCGHMVDHNVHHKTTDPEYHHFESSQSEAAAATGD